MKLRLHVHLQIYWNRCTGVFDPAHLTTNFKLNFSAHTKSDVRSPISINFFIIFIFVNFRKLLCEVQTAASRWTPGNIHVWHALGSFFIPIFTSRKNFLSARSSHLHFLVPSVFICCTPRQLLQQAASVWRSGLHTSLRRRTVVHHRHRLQCRWKQSTFA